MQKIPDKPQEKVIEAAGGIVWRETPSGRQLALIHRPSHNDWTLPKGKREAGESWQETALREVFEETGLEAELDSFAGSIGYTVEGVAKVVLFWNMRANPKSVFKSNHEVDQLIWVSLEEALEKISYADEVSLLRANRI